MYHAVYPQMVIALNPQEAGIPGSSTISLYDGVQFLSLSNSQDSEKFRNNTINRAGATVGSTSAYGQNMTFNPGNILNNQQQTNNVLAMSNSNKLISLTNSLESNHGHTNVANNQYNHEVLPPFNQPPQNMHQNYNGFSKQFGNQQKDRKYGNYNQQHAYGNKYNNQNNYKRQNITVFNNGDRPQQSQNKRNGGNRGENQNQNQNNNYQQHNRNHYNQSTCKRNWGWQNKQRNQPKIVRNVDCSSSASSSSSARMSSTSPLPLELKQTPTKNDPEDSVNSLNNTQITPRKSPTLGEFMLKTLIGKDRQMKHCSKNLSMKRNNVNTSLSKENFTIGASNNCIFAESWADHYGFANHQTYYNNKSYRMNQQLENKHYQYNQQLINGYGNHKKRDFQDKPQNVRDHRFGVCYQRTRKYHISLAKDQLSNADKAKPIGHSIPYSLHNLVHLYNYYNLTPFENLPYCPKNFFVPADRFIIKAQAGISPDESLFNVCDSPADNLSQAIWHKYLLVRQTKDMYRSKLMLWKYLFLFIKNFHVRYSLFLVGSTMTGFASNNSDVDFCLIVKNSEIDQRNEAHSHLDCLFKLISDHAQGYFVDMRLFPAKVPILRFHDSVQQLDVDLNCNNFVGIRNTHLLHCYNQMDWRLRPLVLTVKQWARGNQMNSARESTISSYSLTLMVIHYMQCGVTPPILPCLHAMYPEKFDCYNDIHSIDIHEKLEHYKTDNKQSLGDLLLGFFDYYSNFDYTSKAISVRLAKLIDIEICKHEPMPKNDPGQWMHICIEEPFDRTNTARSVYLYNMFLYIKSVFNLSHQNLKQTRDLERIMDLGLSIPDSQSSSPPLKSTTVIKPEIKKSKFRNGCLDSEISDQIIEIVG